jgi:hypothetical protein
VVDVVMEGLQRSAGEVEVEVNVTSWVEHECSVMVDFSRGGGRMTKLIM